MSSKAVESALVTTHEIITSPVYTHKFPDGYVNENYPIREGGWWGQLTYSLEGRWDTIKKQHRRETGAFDKDEADGQTKLVTDGGRVQDEDGVNRSGETAAIFTSHGVLDATTTILAARAVGPSTEANPIVRELLAMGELPAAVAMLAVVGLCCGAWPIAADALETPEWVGLGIATIGAVVAAVNLVVVFA